MPAWPSRTDNPNELVRPGSLRFPVSAEIAESAGPEVQRIPVQAGELRLETALQLLQRSGQAWPEGVEPGSTAWMQALVDGLCELSSRDPLTGLANRRQFEAALDREVDRVARSGEPALLLLADIDHFKRVNDTHGHAAGDLVIQAVARTLQDSVRPMDTVARIGGEEFAAVLPSCPPAFGRAVAERVRKAIEGLAIPISPRQSLQITISIGGAFAPAWVRSSPSLWLGRADQQLYRAKSNGRNCTQLEATPVSEVTPEERGLLFGSAANAMATPPADASTRPIDPSQP